MTRLGENGPDLVCISLGAGVQSTTLYLMACAGELAPKPDAAIFADTGAEPPEVYAHLWWLAENFGRVIPIRVVSFGDIEAGTLAAIGGKTVVSAPFRVLGPDGRAAMLGRQCTREYKIRPIIREMRELLGLTRGERAAGVVSVEQWIDISLDEVQRVKPSRELWIENRWPLVEFRMTRRDCLAWIESRGYPLPPKSSCYFCPYHDDATWRRQRDEDPETWARSIAFDRALRSGKLGAVSQPPYLHGSLLPLDQAPIDGDDRQLNLFNNECEGMCGV